VIDPTWPVHELAPDVRVRVAGPMPALPAALEAEVERLWQAALARGARLFNGRVFSADRLSPSLIEGHWTEYRRVVARMDRPDLGPELPVAPLAVGGVIEGGSGAGRFVLFGRRPVGAVYQAGEWQLPPAGSLDPSAADGDAVDPLRQLLSEMGEELGLPPDAVTDPRPLCVVEHPGSGVLDFGISVRTHWTAAAILAAHAHAPHQEYVPLAAVTLADLPAFLARHAGQVTQQAFAFLARAGL
jgi:hypothetical protein